jgi:pimeloyl-ACP methyl ester carboxylesterase
MELHAPKIKDNIPFLWIAGESDFISDGTGKYIYGSVPPNPNSKFIHVEGGHGDVRENGRDIIIDWIKTL